MQFLCSCAETGPFLLRFNKKVSAVYVHGFTAFFSCFFFSLALQFHLFRWQSRVRRLPRSQILLWATLEGPPRALQTSECHELLNPTRTSCLILAQRQPGKLLEKYDKKRQYHNVLVYRFSSTEQYLTLETSNSWAETRLKIARIEH